MLTIDLGQTNCLLKTGWVKKEIWVQRYIDHNSCGPNTILGSGKNEGGLEGGKGSDKS